MSEKTSSLTIKFGAGYDAPWFVATGTVDEQHQQITEAFGFEPERTKVRTLAELAVEASLIAHSLVNAATIGAKPEPKKQEPTFDPGDEETRKANEPAPKKRAPKKSIASKARSAQPEENTQDIEALVAGAASLKGLADVYKKFQDTITKEQLKLFSARKAELESDLDV